VWKSTSELARLELSRHQADAATEKISRRWRGAPDIYIHTDFATSSKYGYVTSCPSNLGTGMRASVHVKICVEINQCVGCTPSSRRRVDGVEDDAMNAP